MIKLLETAFGPFLFYFQIVENNHLNGVSCYSYKYDFMGNVLVSHEKHTANGTTHTVLTENTYDHRNRLLTTTTKLNDGTPATVTYAYNELGQLVEKGLGNVSTVGMDYNIQGWLTSQTSDNFSMTLRYYDPQRGTQASYSGNISEWEWGHGSPVNQYYKLLYDTSGRLTSGIHSAGNHETIGGYDLNGNIQRMTRTGSTAADFAYAYKGNQLLSLNNGSHYEYDPNGNMTNDPRKNLTFTYNSLNLVQEVRSGSTVKAKYQYAADGTKLKVEDKNSKNGYDYLGSVTLVKNTNTITPEVAFAEGIIRGSNILFFEKDHLGSVRTVMNTTGGAPQYIDYYPFGTQYTGQIDNVNRYRFNGKEIQLTGGLNLIDFNTRMYDQELGRFHNMDWLVEEFPHQSPFAFADNNPVRYIDFMGMNAIESKYFTEQGELLLETDDNHPDRIIVVPDKQVEDFKRHIELTSDKLKNSDGWNNYWAEEFGEFVLTPDEQTSVYSFHSSKAQNAAIGYIINPSQSNYWRMVGTEMAAQWTTPELIVAGLSAGAAGYSSLQSAANIGKVANSARGWLGRGYKVIRNKSGDYIFTSRDGLRKMRFDLKNTTGDRPHIHLEVYRNGKWRDATTTHRIYPKN